jgi:predicted PolB exonuclease-like 3'-5' exonuclease
MTPVLVFDIETIPDVAGLRALYGSSETTSDAEIAARAFAERAAKVGHEFLAHHLHRVVAISCVFRDDEGLRVRSLGVAGDDEVSLVQAFFRTIDKYTPQLVSWNGSGFDLPVLGYRALVHGLSAPRFWELGDDDREFRFNNYISRYHLRHTDVMDLLAMYQPRASAPLDQVAKLCGFPGKLGMDGSQVWPAYQEGRLDEIRNYCETDVINTWLVYCRFQLLRGILTIAQYLAEVERVRATLAGIDAAHWREYLAAWPLAAQPS